MTDALSIALGHTAPAAGDSQPAPPKAPATLTRQERPRRQPTPVPCSVSPRITSPEVTSARERFTAGIDRYITPELAAAAELRALRAERAELSRQLDEQARLLLGSRSWRLGRFLGGRGPSAGEIAGMPTVPQKLQAIWAVMRSRRWEATAPLRLLGLLRRRP